MNNTVFYPIRQSREIYKLKNEIGCSQPLKYQEQNVVLSSFFVSIETIHIVVLFKLDNCVLTNHLDLQGNIKDIGNPFECKYGNTIAKSRPFCALLQRLYIEDT